MIARTVPTTTPERAFMSRPLSVSKFPPRTVGPRFACCTAATFDPFAVPLDGRQQTESGFVQRNATTGVNTGNATLDTMQRQSLFRKLSTPYYQPQQLTQTYSQNTSRMREAPKPTSAFRQQEIRKNVNTKYVLQIIDTDRAYRSPELTRKEGRIGKIREMRERE
ncbi:hypothetical protein SS50377_20394 [Spironucleus salmonicida]|nr:hypothetical protein SS50377_20394 [Spironucleus salmonicida]